MSNFIELHVKDCVFDSYYINMDLVQEILPSVKIGYGARLIFVGVNSQDNDCMYSDVMETADEILSKAQ